MTYFRSRPSNYGTIILEKLNDETKEWQYCRIRDMSVLSLVNFKMNEEDGWCYMEFVVPDNPTKFIDEEN